ncbi:MAG: helicase Cas3 [Pelotomaculum sp. PtaB.Bin013]|uniref:CRISPR-associated helicase Cas3 n=1 Tax=Pelotomaculum isophthalicicum JI TaxID=947010 RepID=A0A9X4H076_9FIRM|nr:CRISPR-associated helicase Cas3' [Pelotomaculum isophthalicicum]MDF9407071.1 CRISPR-associated helicase Cas3' [Pelotomaculum isophthalicicum JI]OPX85827.1 MAG: helicase Cas3 [Pelotomaculum sp. PtaB.Bin013]
MKQYFAHYDKDRNIKQLLKEHLSSVSASALLQVPPNLRFKKISITTVRDIVFWLGYCHDLGKYTDYFQDYLLRSINSHLKNHAHISACFLYMLLLDRLSDLQDGTQKRIIAFLAYLCARLHHGALNLDGLFKTSQENEMRLLLQAFENNLAAKAVDILKDSELSNSITPDQFKNYLHIDRLLAERKHFIFMPQYFSSGRASEDQWFLFTIYLFSLLIDSDKLDSGGLKPGGVKSIFYGCVSDYLDRKPIRKPNESLTVRREKARRTMLGVIDGLSNDDIKNVRFFTLTAPTGIGKTLSSLQCALRLQERIKEIENYTPRIITAIPFINIIEQTKKEYENVFNNKLRLVVHHRLGDFSVKAGSNEETPIDKALLEVESWEGDIILTTFVQLFQSIFTGQNRLLKKINKLAGSIVILDEAQAIPEKYMPLIGAVLQKISTYWGTRFILMTATQPKILDFGNLLLNDKKNPEKQVISLLPDYPEYFKDLKRTKFIPLLDRKLDTKEFISLFQEKGDVKKSTLVVVNTIKRSVEIYREIKKILKNNGCEVPVYYLSTNIIPKKRSEVIAQVKTLLDNEQPVILVSTQTIEAGVDLDFYMAFRDFAPLDSLIQTAGRVNREGKKGEYLPVYIVQLESDNHYVYTLMHRKSTQDLIKNKGVIIEPQFGRLAEEYYALALKRGVSDISRELWQEGILKLNFEKMEEFMLIENSEEVVDVFVEDGSPQAAFLADAYEELLRNKEYFNCDLTQVFERSIIPEYNQKLSVFERKALVRLVLTKLNDYVIQVRTSRLKKNRPIEFSSRGGVPSSMYWIPPGQLYDFYDKDTGFISETGDAFIL